MLEANIKMTFATEAKAQTDKFPLSPNSIDGMGAAEDWQAITEAQDSSVSSMKNNTALLKEFGNIMPEIIKNLRIMNDAIIKNNQNQPTSTVSHSGSRSGSGGNTLEKGVLQTVNTGGSMLQSAYSGDFSGSLITGINGASNTIGNLSQSASSSGMGGLASALGKASITTAIIGAAIGVGKKLNDAYREAMPTIFGSGKAFGTTDDDLSMLTYKKINTFNNGTGLDNDAFNSLVVGLRKQGIGNNLDGSLNQAALAGSIAETTSKWAYATGGDSSQFANFGGLMSRYGGSKNIAGDFNYVMSAGLATGLNESQLPEFLSSIEKVMEDGIAKGFSRSATEVADTMLMFSKLSGGDAFWQGEQDEKMLNQANAGLANATSLSKTTDLIAYRAISQLFPDEESQRAALKGVPFVSGGSYVNKMMLLEQGLTENNFGALLGGIYSTTSDEDSQVERIRQMFGLNYTGASRVRDLYEQYKDGNYDDNFKLKLSEIKNAPENQNNETKWQQAVNKIQEVIQDKGKGIFDNVVNIASDTSKIASFLVGEDTPERVGDNLDAYAADPKTGRPLDPNDYGKMPTIKAKEYNKQRAYINGDYGPTDYHDMIMGLVGNDESKYNDFLNFVFSPNTRETKEFDELRNVIVAELADTFSDKWERDRTGHEINAFGEESKDSVRYWLEAIYNIFNKMDKEGLTLN